MKAQSFGDDLDIDALIQAIVEMKSGSHMREDIYIRRDKRIRDVAVLFLVDLSGSTEEQVNGRRVIDIQKEAMTLMAEALDSLGDPFAIYGFCSEGRFRVDLFSVKSFEDDYQDAVRFRLGNLEPANLTRMGAVIRHGIAKLEPVDAMIKVMIIITDGRPYDLEYGNLDYAMADTRKAFKEARSKRIHPFVITSDDKGITYLRQICSQTQSIILPKVEVLPRILPALYKRLTL
jgi:nitric oxide reductase activation protein